MTTKPTVPPAIVIKRRTKMSKQLLNRVITVYNTCVADLVCRKCGNMNDGTLAEKIREKLDLTFGGYWNVIIGGGS